MKIVDFTSARSKRHVTSVRDVSLCVRDLPP